MKAIKIDIKRELVEIPYVRPYIVAHHENMLAYMKTGEAIPPQETITREDTYFPRRVYNPHVHEMEIYLVKQNEDKIFTDLMTVQDDDINQNIKQAVEIAEEKTFYKTRYQTMSKIKKLPWYKRLFNKFSEDDLML